MTEQSHLSDLDLQILEASKALRLANEKKAMLEKARLEKARADQLERQLKLEREKKALEEENERKVAAIVEVRRLRAEADLKARRDSEEEDRRLAVEADRLRIQQEERVKADIKLREIQQAAYADECEAHRLEQELLRQNQPAPEPEKQVDVRTNHPLAFIFQGQPQEKSTAVVQHTPVVPSPAPKKTERTFTQADLNAVLSYWPSANRPEPYIITELLQEFSAEAIIGAVNSFKGTWANNGTLGGYAAEHVRLRLSGSTEKA